MPKKRIFVATAQVISVWDGDTFKASIDLLENREIPPAQKVDLGFRLFLESADSQDAIGQALATGVHLTHEVNVRLFGVGAPELHEPAGQASRDFLVWALPIGSTVRLFSKRLDKYGRVEANVYRPDGLHINAEIIRLGHAKPATARG
jgi:endonuclease YncB( thermonuclease family)